MKAELRYRYPGVAPFSTAQKEIFFGRELDVQRLTVLVTNEQQVLLYAKSGLGKSSLINAGLLPHLFAQPDSIVVQIRIGAYQGPQSPSPLAIIHAALPPAPVSFLDQVIAQEGSLWQHFKAIALTYQSRKSSDAQLSPTMGHTPRFYLIFDQFEELFTHPKDSIFAFKKQMADLLYAVVPKRFRAVLEIKQGVQPDILDEAALHNLNQSMDLHVLYAIREDRYSHLNRLADYLPDLLHTRFQLGPLTRANAEAAITRPAGLKEGFETAPFHYSTDALNSILDYLTKDQQQAVETTQLQILCSRLEHLGKPGIRKEHIPAFDDIFLEFYYDCIRGLPSAVRNDVQAFIEDELIKSGQRIALDRLVCLEYLDADVLDTLLRDRHLLRAEQNSTGGTSLELSHDTLIAPILRARSVRHARIAEADRLVEETRLQEELKREQAERQRKIKQLRKTRRLLLMATIGIVIAVAAMGYAVLKRQRAMESEKRALFSESETNRAWVNATQLFKSELAEQMRIKKEVEQWVVEANRQIRKGKLSIAIEYLQKAYQLDRENAIVKQLLRECGAIPTIQYPPRLVGSARETLELLIVGI